MPLHEPPIQKCGSGHWLTEPCPRGVCARLVFEKDIPVYKPVKGRRPISAVVDGTEAGHCKDPLVQLSERDEAAHPDKIEVAKAAVEEGKRKSALSAAEKQRRYRERQKAKRLSEE